MHIYKHYSLRLIKFIKFPFLFLNNNLRSIPFQRFTHALSQSMRNLAEPIVAADRLQEFGAAYVNQEGIAYEGFNACIPHSYWDRLSAAVTTTAKEFLNKQQVKGFTSFFLSTIIYLYHT